MSFVCSREMATATTSVDNSLPAETASDSVEARSNVSPMEGFTEVYEPMQQCIASGSFTKQALLPVESVLDSLEGTCSVSPTDSST